MTDDAYHFYVNVAGAGRPAIYTETARAIYMYYNGSDLRNLQEVSEFSHPIGCQPAQPLDKGKKKSHHGMLGLISFRVLPLIGSFGSAALSRVTWYHVSNCSTD